MVSFLPRSCFKALTRKETVPYGEEGFAWVLEFPVILKKNPTVLHQDIHKGRLNGDELGCVKQQAFE
jgi:hypothetical protein